MSKRATNSGRSDKKAIANGASRKAGQFESLVDQKFGRLRVLSYAGRIPGGRNTIWKCRCDCANEIVTSGSSLKSGRTKSCGCYRREQIAKAVRKHGHSADGKISTEYRAWQHIQRRCENPSDNRYPMYGGRGIKMCVKWRKSFAAFLADVGPKPSPKHSIGRIDNDDNYKPGNVRWETPLEQGANTSRTRNFTIDGRTMHLAAWVREAGLHFNTVRRRMNSGLSLKQALDLAVKVPTNTQPQT